ncbi:uncharacterized protein LOC127288900 [Leptopilina boulardi]|uniref:uncharacterized protein LOC127288900 n=1 Tax=Leptopilina boulardi TaxID=63433 RepID=UPI0021F5E8A3|nr:uncharacterized protein LOC127288900 [Leptopilina boulardi]
MRTTCVLVILFLYLKYTICLIVPDEIPSLLSLIYSNLPPVKKGTDSRFGVGFSLGEHADFQVVVELGPQTETEPIGSTEDAKRRRDIILNAAMKGEMGPWAQRVAEHQIQRKLGKDVATITNHYGNIKNIHKDSKEKEPFRANIIDEKKKHAENLKKSQKRINVVNVEGTKPSAVISDPESYIKKLNTLYDTQKSVKM